MIDENEVYFEYKKHGFAVNPKLPNCNRCSPIFQCWIETNAVFLINNPLTHVI